MREKSDMNPTYILYFAIAMIVAAVVIHLGIWWMFRFFEQQQARRDTRPALVTTPLPKPQPLLQITPQGDLEDLRRQENEILSTYRWIDRDKGIARIPVDRAMQIFLEGQKK
jgi:hypothetical protein